MAWLTRQLLRDADRTHVWDVPNDAHEAPRTFDDPSKGAFVPRWGSVALLTLAVQSRAVGLDPSDVALRDSSGLPLQEEDGNSARERVVAALREGDLHAALGHLEGPGGPYTVLDVELSAPDGARIQVGRFGWYEISKDQPATALLSAASDILSIS